MKLSDYYFSYSGRYRGGSFDMRNVIRWQSEGEAYYLKYVIYLKDADKVILEPHEFQEFESKFLKLEI